MTTVPHKQMPRCSEPRCPHRKPCPIHTKPRSRDLRTNADRGRGSSAQRGYDAAYRRKREALLVGDPVCYWGCGRKATTGEHIPPLSNFDDPSQWAGDLVAACGVCNFSMVGQD